ncbi:nucleotidyltransferase [Porphyromonadaceae bacterium]
MTPTLYVLAAGMGSRYGGLKQLDGVGPNGETIMDYSIYDAVRAGSGKVVFVIRHQFEADFKEKIISKYKHIVAVELVFQELTNLPEGFTPPAERVKPWGTNHAVLMAKGVINEPFAVINADDYYGQESFKVLADFLQSKASKKNEYCMIGYRLGNTLSESGSVARGVCSKDEQGMLTSVVEHTKIEKIGESIISDFNGEQLVLDELTPVSMNMWGFTPDYFDYSEQFFIDFLKENADNIKAEYFIPLAVNTLIQSKTVTLEVLDTPSKWFGVTYAEDRPTVVTKLAELHNSGIYPAKLF